MTWQNCTRLHRRPVTTIFTMPACPIKQTGSCETHRENSMANELKFPKWREPYLEALMETDERKLVTRVKLAESAILMRLRAIQSDSNMVVEQQAIEDALNGLTVLKRWPVQPPVN